MDDQANSTTTTTITALPTPSDVPVVPPSPEPEWPERKPKSKLPQILGGIAAIILVAGVATAAYFVSVRVSGRQAIAPTAPVSEPLAVSEDQACAGDETRAACPSCQGTPGPDNYTCCPAQYVCRPGCGCQPESGDDGECVPTGVITCNPDCPTACGYTGGTISCTDSCGGPSPKTCPATAACLPGPKTWEVTTVPVCPTGSAVSARIRMYRIIWPQSTGGFDIAYDTPSQAATHFMSITNKNMLSASQGIYVGLEDATTETSFPASGISPNVYTTNGNNPPATGDFVNFATYFNPPTPMVSWNSDRLAAGSYTIRFAVPAAYCETTTVCIDTTWTPDPALTCTGTNVTQTSNCGNTRTVAGTKDCSAAGVCTEIKIYKKVNGVWGAALTQAQLQALQVGDVVKGVMTTNMNGLAGVFTVTVNGVLQGSIDGTTVATGNLISSPEIAIPVAGTYKIEGRVNTTVQGTQWTECPAVTGVATGVTGGACTEIKYFLTVGGVDTALTNLTSVKVGDQLKFVFTATGTTRVQARVGTGAWIETTKNATTGKFEYTYNVTTVGTFNVEARYLIP